MSACANVCERVLDIGPVRGQGAGARAAHRDVHLCASHTTRRNVWGGEAVALTLWCVCVRAQCSCDEAREDEEFQGILARYCLCIAVRAPTRLVRRSQAGDAAGDGCARLTACVGVVVCDLLQDALGAGDALHGVREHMSTEGTSTWNQFRLFGAPSPSDFASEFKCKAVDLKAREIMELVRCGAPAGGWRGTGLRWPAVHVPGWGVDRSTWSLCVPSAVGARQKGDGDYGGGRKRLVARKGGLNVQGNAVVQQQCLCTCGARAGADLAPRVVGLLDALVFVVQVITALWQRMRNAVTSPDDVVDVAKFTEVTLREVATWEMLGSVHKAYQAEAECADKVRAAL